MRRPIPVSATGKAENNKGTLTDTSAPSIRRFYSQLFPFTAVTSGFRWCTIKRAAFLFDLDLGMLAPSLPTVKYPQKHTEQAKRIRRECEVLDPRYISGSVKIFTRTFHIRVRITTTTRTYSHGKQLQCPVWDGCFLGRRDTHRYVVRIQAFLGIFSS